MVSVMHDKMSRVPKMVRILYATQQEKQPTLASILEKAQSLFGTENVLIMRLCCDERKR